MSDLTLKYDKTIKDNVEKRYQKYKSLFEMYLKLKKKSKKTKSLTTTLEKYEEEINNIIQEMENQYNAMMNVSNYLDRKVLEESNNSYANRKGKEQQKLFLGLLDKQEREISRIKSLLD